MAKFFSSEKHLHNARFALLHELKNILSDKLDGTNLLLGESIFNHVLKAQPTETQKELANLLLVGRTRSGKGLHIESELLSWPHPAIVNDIKGELHQRTAGYREEELGGKVFVLDPTGKGHRYDPLEGKFKDSDLQSAATNLLYKHDEGENKVFTDRAITMLTQIFHAARLEAKRLLPFTQQMIYSGLPGAAFTLEEISQKHDFYPNLATRFLDVDILHADFKDKFLLSCWGTFTSRMNRLLTKESVLCFTGSDFTAKALITSDKPITVYLRWPEKDLLSLSPLVHLIWNSLMDGMIDTYDTLKGENCKRVLAVLDEIGRTGLPNLPEYATTVCGRNISLLVPIQSLSQLDGVFGKYKADTLRAQMESQIFYRPADHETAEYLEKSLGYKSGFAHSKTDHEGGVSKGESEQRIPLMTAQEIKLLGDDEIIGFRSGFRPFRAKRMDWRRFPILAQRQRIPPPQLFSLPQLEEKLPDTAGLKTRASFIVAAYP